MAHETGHFGIGDLFLQDNPRASFFNAVKPFNSSPFRQRFNEGRFDPVFNRFLGQLGGEAQGGDLPTLTFEQFLKDFNFNEDFFQSPRSLRGITGSNLNPRTRFLFGF